MIPTTTQRIAASTTRRLATAQPIRRLSHLTMGFDEIAQWKKEKRRASEPRHHPKTQTIFDLRVYTPIHKSTAWNISYVTDEVTTGPQKLSQISTSLPSPVPGAKRIRLHSRHFAAAAAGQPTIANDVKAKVHRPIRVSDAANMFSSLATETKSIETIPSLAFCLEQQSTEISDVPGLDVLSKLRVEKLSYADLYQSESKAPGHSTNDDDVPVEQSSQLRVPNPEDEDDLSTARGAPVWYP